MRKLLCKTLSEFFIFLPFINYGDSEVSEPTLPVLYQFAFLSASRLLARKTIFASARVVRALLSYWKFLKVWDCFWSTLGANQREPFHIVALKRKWWISMSHVIIWKVGTFCLGTQELRNMKTRDTSVRINTEHQRAWHLSGNPSSSVGRLGTTAHHPARENPRWYPATIKRKSLKTHSQTPRRVHKWPPFS